MRRLVASGPGCPSGDIRSTWNSSSSRTTATLRQMHPNTRALGAAAAAQLIPGDGNVWVYICVNRGGRHAHYHGCSATPRALCSSLRVCRGAISASHRRPRIDRMRRLISRSATPFLRVRHAHQSRLFHFSSGARTKSLPLGNASAAAKTPSIAVFTTRSQRRFARTPTLVPRRGVRRRGRTTEFQMALRWMQDGIERRHSA